MDVTSQIDEVTDDLARLVGATQPDQLDAATPCAKWQVRDLLMHVVGGLHFFAAALRGETPPAGAPGDLLGDDPAAAYRAAADDFRDALKDPQAMERTISLPFGDLPGPAFAQLAVFDLLVHSWDLATACGSSFSPNEEIVTGAAAFARSAIPPTGAARDGDTFAEPVEPQPDATPIERLAAYAGRQI